MERKILGVTWEDRKTNCWVREQTRCRDVISTVKGYKWSWAGHLARRMDDRWSIKTTLWVPSEGKRGRGRPKCRWVDDITKYTRDWVEKAGDRAEWRSMREAFVQQWT
ncbi:hypothetical protein ACW0TE_00840 [Fusobacterium polymorphum]